MKKITSLLPIPFALLLCACQPEATPAPVYMPPVDLVATQVPYVTPSTPQIIIGTVVNSEPASPAWPSYTNNSIGYSLQYPPDWVVSEDENGAVHLLPPGSDTLHPSAEILIDHYALPYQDGVSIFNIPAEFYPFDRAQSQYYIPTQLMLPTQSAYLELSYRGGVLVFQITIGPSYDLRPSFDQIYRTLSLLN